MFELSWLTSSGSWVSITCRSVVLLLTWPRFAVPLVDLCWSSRFHQEITGRRLVFLISVFMFLFVCVYCSVWCVRRSYGCGRWQISEFVWFLLVLAGSSILVVHICLFMLMETNGGVLRLDFSSSRLCLLCLLVRDRCFFS